MKNLCVFSLLFFFSFSLFSQNLKNEKANEFSSNGKYTEAIKLRKEILKSIDDKNSDAYKEQRYKIKLAKSFLTNDLQKWLSLVEESLSIFKSMEKQAPDKKIRLNIEYTNILLGTGHLDKAFKVGSDIYEYILEQEKTSGKSYEKEAVDILGLLANTKWFMQDYAGAIEQYKKVLEKTKELYGYYSKETASIHRMLAMVNTFTNDLNTTIDHAEKVVEIYEKIHPENKYLLYRQYFNNFIFIKDYGDLEKLARLLKKIKAYCEENKDDLAFINVKDRSFPNFNVVRTIYLFTQLQYASATGDTTKTEHFYKLFQKEIPSVPVSYTRREQSIILNSTMETGKVFHNHGNYEKAEKYYSRALKFSKNTSFNFGQLQAFMLLSSLGVDSQKWDDAIAYAEKAFQNPDFEKFPYPAKFYYTLGNAYFGKGEYEKATSHLNKVIEEYSNDGANANYYAIQNLNGTGSLFLKMYQTQSKEKYLEKAYSAYRKSSQLLSRLYRGGEYNDRLSSLRDGVSEGLLQSALILDQHQREVMGLIERNNSDYLWSNFLKNRKGDFQNAIGLAHKKDSLFAKREHYAGILKDSTKISEKEKNSLQEKLDKTAQAYENTEKELKKKHPSFFRFSNPNFSMANLQTDMGQNEVMLRYVITDSLVFAYAITKNDLVLKQLPVNKTELYKKQTAYLDDLKNISEGFKSKSKELFEILIEPMGIGKFKNLTIIGTGFLSYLPFETLMDVNETYLIQNHPIAYSTSLKMWRIQNHIEDNTENGLLAFSPEYSMTLAANTNDKNIKTLVRGGNYELLGAKKEAEQIHHIFKGKLFTSENATKENFIEYSSKYDVLHLAMHAIIDEENPDKSTLIFSNNEKLYLPKLYTMNIPAKLAVLSACNTGAGELKYGEGVQSLSRAFTFAGVKSTVMSLWPVPDRETSKLMVSFYKNLKKGQSKDKALQMAKINYLENTTEVKLKHPYYWAGFVVSGDVSPIISSTNTWMYILIAAIILLVVLFVFRRKRAS